MPTTLMKSNKNYLIDDEEIGRLNINNAIKNYIFKSEFSAPVEEILQNGRTYALDVGCRSGFWLLDMATKYPNSSFVGIDVSPNVPESSKSLSNIAYLRGDLLNGLPFPDDSFDFVHMEDMRSYIKRDQWPQVIRELTRVLKTGGWLELSEIRDEIFNSGPLIKKISDLSKSCIEDLGCDPNIYNKIPDFLKANKSYGKVMHSERKIPSGSWGDGVGILSKRNMLLYCKRFKPYLLPSLKITDEDFNKLLELLNEEIEGCHCYYQCYRIYSQKI